MRAGSREHIQVHGIVTPLSSVFTREVCAYRGVKDTVKDFIISSTLNISFYPLVFNGFEQI